MDKSLIYSWVNPICRVVDEDYVPHLTFVKPGDDMYWDIRIPPNGQFFQVFKEFDPRFPGSRRLPMDFERLCDSTTGTTRISRTSGQTLDQSKSRLVRKDPSKTPSFTNTLLFATKLIQEYQADFPQMNLEELFLIARVFNLKIEKYHNLKIAYGKVCYYLRSLVCDFISIDA